MNTFVRNEIIERFAISALNNIKLNNRKYSEKNAKYDARRATIFLSEHTCYTCSIFLLFCRKEKTKKKRKLETTQFFFLTCLLKAKGERRRRNPKYKRIIAFRRSSSKILRFLKSYATFKIAIECIFLLRVFFFFPKEYGGRTWNNQVLNFFFFFFWKMKRKFSNGK